MGIPSNRAPAPRVMKLTVLVLKSFFAQYYSMLNLSACLPNHEIYNLVDPSLLIFTIYLVWLIYAHE